MWKFICLYLVFWHMLSHHESLMANYLPINRLIPTLPSVRYRNSLYYFEILSYLFVVQVMWSTVNHFLNTAWIKKSHKTKSSENIIGNTWQYIPEKIHTPSIQEREENKLFSGIIRRLEIKVEILQVFPIKTKIYLQISFLKIWRKLQFWKMETLFAKNQITVS